MVLRDFYTFFFFKQKTAYEIGTGDWSSDVCSSDLVAALLPRVDLPEVLLEIHERTGFLNAFNHAHEEEIGRASCRERV